MNIGKIALFIIGILISTIPTAGAITWDANTSVIAGLGTVGTYSRPSFFLNNNTWTAIIGQNDGTFAGFTWNGTQWVSNSSQVLGLGDVGFTQIQQSFTKTIPGF